MKLILNLVFMIIYFFPTVSHCEIIRVTGEKVSQGEIGGVDLTGQSLETIIEVSDNLAFNDSGLITAPDSGDLINITLVINGVVFTADQGTFQSGLSLEFGNSGFNTIVSSNNAKQHSIFSGLQVGLHPSGQLLSTFFNENGGQKQTFSVALFNDSFGLTFNQGIPLTKTLTSDGGNGLIFFSVESNQVPEPSTYMLLFILFCGLLFSQKTKQIVSQK